MIGTLVRIGWLNLKRDRVALGLTFVLPIVFFSIFAFIFGSISFGGSGGGESRPMRVIVVDLDQTEVSRRFASAIDGLDALDVSTTPRATDEQPAPEPFTRDSAREQVRLGRFPAAIVVPEGFAERFGSFTDAAPVEVIYDSSNPIAEFSISGLLQAAAMTAAPDLLMEKGLDQLALYGGGLTDEQRAAMEFIRPYLAGETPWEDLDDDSPDQPDGAERSADAENDAAAPTGEGFAGLVEVTTTAARAEAADGRRPNMVAYYAAGIGVMFLLFSMAGAGGSLLEEAERGTLERLLATRVSMSTLLLSNWVFFGLIGFAQVALMFVWASVVFGLELWTSSTLTGFLVMTLFTAAAGAAFGIVLASMCHSRAQLAGMSTIVILIMSALGGSMVPQFVAPAVFDMTKPFTFNGWALDGYLKVFWHSATNATAAETALALWPQVSVLGAMTVAFLVIARLFARRWDTA